MTRTVELKLTIVVENEEFVDTSDLAHRVEASLRSGLGQSHSICCAQLRSVDSSIKRCQPLDLTSIIDSSNTSAFIWTVEDVLGVRPDLTREQASRLLGHVSQQHEVNHGFGWFDIEHFAFLLFGPSPDELNSSDGLHAHAG